MTYPGGQSPEEDLNFVTDTAKVARAGWEPGGHSTHGVRVSVAVRGSGPLSPLCSYHRPWQMWPRCWHAHCTSSQEEPASVTP